MRERAETSKRPSSLCVFVCLFVLVCVCVCVSVLVLLLGLRVEAFGLP